MRGNDPASTIGDTPLSLDSNTISITIDTTEFDAIDWLPLYRAVARQLKGLPEQEHGDERAD